jgi:hypothetical protein
MNVGDEIWIFNTQRVVQKTIVEIMYDIDGYHKYVIDGGGWYFREEMGITKIELMEKFFGDIGNPYRHRFLR